jgi:hypothetical protein
MNIIKTNTSEQFKQKKPSFRKAILPARFSCGHLRFCMNNLMIKTLFCI